MVLTRAHVPVFLKFAAHDVTINSFEFWQKVRMAIVSLIEECGIQPKFQNERSILNIKVPNSNKIPNSHDILD